MWGGRDGGGGGGVRSILPLANKHHTPGWWINRICSCTQWVAAEEEEGGDEEGRGDVKQRKRAPMTGNS